MFYSQEKPKIQFQKFTEEQYLPYKNEKFSTIAIHQCQELEPVHGSVNVPFHMTSTYARRDIG